MRSMSAKNLRYAESLQGERVHVLARWEQVHIQSMREGKHGPQRNKSPSEPEPTSSRSVHLTAHEFALGFKAFEACTAG
jgi:hypothetical protein